jgi:hypothetical protein
MKSVYLISDECSKSHLLMDLKSMTEEYMRVCELDVPADMENERKRRQVILSENISLILSAINKAS